MDRCPKCGSSRIVTAFDANFKFFCCDCDWSVGKVSPELRKLLMMLMEEAFPDEKFD